MRPGPALLLLGLAWGLGLGLGGPRSPLGPRGAPAGPPGVLPGAMGLGLRGGLTRLLPRPRAAPPRWPLRAPRRARLRPPAGTPGPGPAAPSAGVAAPSRCPSGAPARVVLTAANASEHRAAAAPMSCQEYPCLINQVRIHRDHEPLLLSRKESATLNATTDFYCVMAASTVRFWQVFPVPAVHALPDWTQPLKVPQLQVGRTATTLHIPRFCLPWGVYLFNLTVRITRLDPSLPALTASDSIYIWVIRRPLKAVLLGEANETVSFSDKLILNGTMSSDPDADDPLEGLRFSWHCTTNPGHYGGGQVTVTKEEVCHPEQASLNWPWASGPVLTLSPETLKGDRVYYFRLVVQKGSKTAFADKWVHMLRGPAPTARISCVENCNSTLVTSERFTLFLNCPSCASRDLYNWSILCASGDEMPFDWAGRTVTGRNGTYLSVKAFAFQNFLEDKFWVSVYLESWSGVTLDLRHSFIINHGPQTGKCKINPAKGIALVTKFVVECSDFKDQHIPLTYKITVADLDGVGEISSVKENTLGSILYLGTGSTAPPSFLPVGVLANHYALKIYVQVYDSLGTFSQVALYATAQPPTDKISAKFVLRQLVNFTTGPTSLLSTLLQKQDWLPAGYLMYVVASVLSNMKMEVALQDKIVNLREHLVNQSFELPVSALEEVNQVVTATTKLTQKASDLTRVAQMRATVRLWDANQALQEYQRKDKRFRSEQIEIVSTGIGKGLSNILKLTTPFDVFEDPFYVIESLSDTILAVKVQGNETTVLKTSNFNMHVEKVEQWDVTQAFRSEKHCHNCLHTKLNVSRVPGLTSKAPVSLMFCEFKDDPFPWLNYPENSSAEVVGFRMTGAKDDGSVIEITPDVVEVHLVRTNLTFGTLNLTMGPNDKVNESSKTTTGGVRFEVDSRGVREVLVHIVTEVTVLFTVSVYAGSQTTPADLVATFLVPHDIPPIVNQSGLFDPACLVKEARVVCLPPSLLQVIAQRSQSPTCTISMILQAPQFVLEPSKKLVRVSVFSVQCLDMDGIQTEWREDTCVLGERTTWGKVHCVCRNAARRRRRQLSAIKLTSLHLHTRYITARVIVVPNPVDLRLNVIKNVSQNPVTLLTMLAIIFLYLVLAFWALHRDEIDQFLRDHVVVLPDNDPYDNVCYLVTVFTGSRCGSGTRANVFVQLRGTESISDVHCLSHPHFRTLYRGSINTFLLTTKSDLGDIHSIRVWHDNEGRAPSWYLSRIKVENLFSRHIWLFMCRSWLSVDTTVVRTFPVTQPDQPLPRKDYFLIDMTHNLGKNHMWFSVFAGVVPRPFTRLQRLSCCLAMLLSSLLCNIMFFNLNKQGQSESRQERYLRSMVIGIESVLITIPVQVLITFLFTYSQKKPQANIGKVTPQKHPLMSEEGGHWRERLPKWYAYETAKEHPVEAAEPAATSGVEPPLPEASPNVTSETAHQSENAETEVPETPDTNTNVNNRNIADDQEALSRASSSQGLYHLERKPQIALPRWCVYIAWFLVFTTSGVSSFFIVFYGLTYGYDKSIEWLFASFCSFCQSIFLVQPSKVMLLTGVRTNKLKYCKNLPWSSKYHYAEIRLHQMRMSAGEMRKIHERIVHIRGSRMYRPLTQDEILIFRRKKRIRRRALLFLSYILTHFIFLALLLTLVVLLCHTDSFYYNQFIRDLFSADLAAVTKLEDIYRWLNNVPLPLFHNDLHPTFILDSSSKILGLPLMRQVRAKPSKKPCLPAENFAQSGMAGEILCHPEYGIDPEDTKSYLNSWNKVGKRNTDKNINGFTYKPPQKKWGYHSHGVLNTYGSGGYAFYFFPEEQQFNSSLRLKELQASHWLDERTWAVILDLTTFNPDASLLCSISVIFEVSPLGVVNSSISVHSFTLADFNRQTSAEIYLYVAILIFFLAYVVDEGYVITQERAAYVRSVYSLLNFALKCIFTMLVVLFFRKHFLATGVIRFYLSNPEDFIPFHVVSQVDHIMRIILAFLLFLTILKTLRYSRIFYDVRLAQRAIQTALPGICHMAFVVSVYFFVYTAFGYLVFGQHEWNYSSLIRATQTIFSYCISAFHDTEFSSNRTLGVLFLSSFMLVMICILINLFQAVILSAYEDMKQPVYEEPSEEVEAMIYLYRRLRTVFRFLTFRPRAKDEPNYFVTMLYGQPERNSYRHLGLKTRNINGRRMVYLVV